MKLQAMVPTLITAAFLSTTFGGVIYSESAVADPRSGLPSRNNYFTTTHVPGDEAGKSARPPIKLPVQEAGRRREIDRTICETLLRDTVQNACYKAGVYKMPSQGGVYHPDSFGIPDALGREWSQGDKAAAKEWSRMRRKHAASNDLCVHEWGGLGWDSSKGVAYIQATGGYCYYYNRGTSAGRGGQNLWRYDTKKCNGSDDHWGCKK